MVLRGSQIPAEPDKKIVFFLNKKRFQGSLGDHSERWDFLPRKPFKIAFLAFSFRGRGGVGAVFEKKWFLHEAV